MTKNDIFSAGKLSGRFSAENGHWGWDGRKGLSWSNSCLQWRVLVLLLPTSSLPLFGPSPPEAGIPLSCTPAGTHLALDELINFVKLILVLLRWWAETHSQGSQSKARADTGWGSRVLWGGVGTGEGRERSRRGWKMLHLSSYWLIAGLLVTLLCEKVGAERTNRYMFFFLIPIYLIQLYRKRKNFTYNCCSRKNVGGGKWRRGRGICSGMAEV